MYRPLAFSAISVAILMAAGSAGANDARAIALGGAVIANGVGVHGATNNPASMMAMQRRGEVTHFRIGANAEFRDSGDAIDAITDESNENLISDIEQEIDILSNQPITCIPIPIPILGLPASDDDAACLTGTQPLSDISGQLLDLLDLVDEESFEGLANFDVGMAFTKGHTPFAINLRVSAAGIAVPDISDDDRDYISEFNTLLDGNTLTVAELNGSTFLEFNDQGIPLNVIQPEDVLQSEGSGGAVIRTQLGVSLARTLQLAGRGIDIGVTPKLSLLSARSITVLVSEEFLDNTTPLVDRFDDAELSETTFTLDVGTSTRLKQFPVTVSGVIRNLIPESISTTEGFEFETTPQFIVGTAYQHEKLTVTGELALNEAEIDGFPTQQAGVGVEYGAGLFKLRGGINNDSARSNGSTVFTLGFGLGALDIGASLTGLEALKVGAQLSFSFK